MHVADVPELHLPVVVGLARGFELTGNTTLQAIVRRFYDLLEFNYTFATGGSNSNEYWQFPGELGEAISVSFNESANMTENGNGYHNQELCSTYNALKIVRYLWLWQPYNESLAEVSTFVFCQLDHAPS